MPQKLADKVALITGADSGIGQGMAELFAANGANIAINYYRDEAGAAETARLVEAAGQRALTVQADVGEPAAVASMFDELRRTFGRIDLMINNAGIGGGGRLHDTDFAIWERVIRTNLHGSFLCAQQAARMMIAQGGGGRIINITSVHQEACGTGGGAYCVSKAGIRNLTRTLALELGAHGITVNNIAPGMILTPMNQRAIDDPDYLHYAESLIPMRRAGVPADIAHMALFLCGDEASYCTGSTYFVDGGWMLTYPPV